LRSQHAKLGQPRMSSPSSGTSTPQPLQAHTLKSKVFVVPTWCDICKGVLVGHGFQCVGCCQRRCHRGLGGNQSENCKAELLLKPCKVVEHVQGEYRFGDVSKQIFRNEKQRIKDIVVTEFMKEQASFGKFEKLKAYSAALQDWWDEDQVIRYTFAAVLLGELATLIISYSLVFLFSWPVHGAARSNMLGKLQAASNFTSVAVFEGLVLLALHMLSRQLILYSELVHGFVREILQIDLAELQIDVGKASLAINAVTIRGLQLCAGVAILGYAVWLRSLWFLYGSEIEA